MKPLFYLFSIIAFFCSCSPRVITRTSTALPSTVAPLQVAVYEAGDSLPPNARAIGSVCVKDGGFAVNCGYDRVMQLAKKAASEQGGNGLYVVTHQTPNRWSSSCHQVSALILHSNDTIDTSLDNFRKEYHEVVNRIRPASAPPANIVSFNVGYGWITSKLYDIYGNRLKGGMGGIKWELQYEYVLRKGWSIGAHVSRFKSRDVPEGFLSLYTIAPQIGYVQRLNRWMFKVDIGMGYVSYDDHWVTRSGACFDVSVGAEYMVLPFMGIGAKAVTSASYFRNENTIFRDETEGLGHIDLLGGVRLYF